MRGCRFVWLGTHKLFDAFTFAFEETEHGWFQAHAYQFDGDTSTFIVETPEHVWRAAGLDDDEKEEASPSAKSSSPKYLDGHALMSNARTCAARRIGSASRASSARTGCTARTASACPSC